MVEKSHPGKWQKTHYWKMTEWKMHTLENDRKITSWKMEEKSPLENDRMENAHPGY